ncbi:putative DNA mismatch repair protein MLH3 [Podospora australis]|uniref:DNA mismatch repair protein MLH3 n=1 Tax=Podospora australis TaxID=1536484 RepID=A0AAN6WPX6_9PEZI|nr:putative DNA mismatch repair protein MLH3 [Podospora australis]
MSIQPLPGDVVAQIKSSATITSLNNAIIGLLENSLDSAASKVNISVDYSRGNCSVEDNGVGIPPSSFHENGGLGRIHYTSKYPARPDCHGKYGQFLASLGALSLLSVTSHHRDYRSHNSLTIHNSRVVARNVPARPEQQVSTFPTGTRVTVRDLFGSMPVRVKQRAAVVERQGTTRFLDQLIFNCVALCLAWPQEVTLIVRDVVAQKTVTLHSPTVTDRNQDPRAAAQDMLVRTPMVLSSVNLIEPEHEKGWISVGATAPGVSVRGCISLKPVPTKRVQFLALGIQPLLNEHQSNFLYDEVNKVFVNSSFGVVEEVGFDEDGQPLKMEMFTRKELQPRKGVDRWPMFFFQISLEENQASVDAHDFLDERHRHLAVISDLLQVMVYELLKKHHFRPNSVHAIEQLKREKAQASVAASLAKMRTESPPTRPSRPLSSKETATLHRTNPTRSNSRSTGPRSSSPFASWSRTKNPTHQVLRAKGTVPSGSAPALDNRSTINTSLQETLVPHAAAFFPSDSIKPAVVSEKSTQAPSFLQPTRPLFDGSGDLTRQPFEDVDESSPDLNGSRQISEVSSSTNHGDDSDAPIAWIDPATNIKSLVDLRTGFMVKQKPRHDKPSNSDAQEASSGSLSKWKPIMNQTDKTTFTFRPTEAAIPRLPQDSEKIGEQTGCGSHACELSGIGFEGHNHTVSAAMEGQISRHALQCAEIISQVDNKFILVKILTGCDDTEPREATMLVIIDQHAADERCRVERLLQDYFVEDPSDHNMLMADTQTLDKALVFELSGLEGDLLARFRRHFADWGVGYELMSREKAGRAESSKVAVKVRMLPPAILERCRTEPRVLIDMLRREIWKLHDDPSRQLRVPRTLSARKSSSKHVWFARFHNCPEGILELINSRACRSSIMFNDSLTKEQCTELVQQLAACAFPFRCAHGRPSMVPLVHIGSHRTLESFGMNTMQKGHKQQSSLLGDMKEWAKRKKEGLD